MRKIKLQKIVILYLNMNHGHLEICSLSQAIETSRQFLLLRTVSGLIFVPNVHPSLEKGSFGWTVTRHSNPDQCRTTDTFFFPMNIFSYKVNLADADT